MKLGQAFDPRANALNAFRLVLAVIVILWHAFPLTGRDVSFWPFHQLLSEVEVDGFFTISGFLITASWFRRPRVGDYLIARALRILPAFYTCLVVTAFVVAPIGLAMQGGSAGALLRSSAPIEYVGKNIGVWMFQFNVGATPRGIPIAGAWNGSLWTLGWELICYLAVVAIGVLGLFARRWFLPTALVLLLLFSLVPWSTLLPPIINALPAIGARFGLMFGAGALVYQFRNILPARWSLVAASMAVVLAASFLPNYRLVAAIPLAYAIIVAGALIRNECFTVRTDLSYGMYIYAFPIQQLLVIGGLGWMNPFAFWILAATATVPFAALSWFMIEKPAMSWKSRFLPSGSS